MRGSSGSIHKENVRRKRYISGPMFGPFSFINVSSGKDVLDAGNGNKNMVEVAVTLRIVRLLYKECASSKHKISIAVLSPYPSQVQFIQQKLENHDQNNEFFKVNVGLLHKYQGGEVDVMIISTGGSDGDEFSDFNRNNTNVCLTLARHCLWILGDERVLSKEESIWGSLVLEAKERQCFFHAHEHKDLAKVVVEVNKDLQQLEDLLSRESTLFQSTEWKVLLSSNFRKSFTKIESLEIKKLVLLMLLKLSSGWRPKGSSTAASINESSCSELIKEFKVRGLHLICTIGIVKETQYTQVLNVWDILPFHEITELVKRLEGIIGMYTQDYINHCKEKCVQRGFEFPMNWPVTCDIIQYRSEAGSDGYVETVKVHESLLLMKFYSLSSGAVNNMISGCDGGDISLPFELTKQEKDVVSFDKSSFILGRSGTGKTTALTMKLFQNEQLHHLACEGFHEERESKDKQDVLRQLFVTFSPKLCYAVKQHVAELKRLTCGGSSSNQRSLVNIDAIDQMMLFEDIPNTFIHLPHEAYPLVITFHRFLLMLDGTVGPSYFERFPGARHLISGTKTSASRLVALERYMRFNDVTYDRFSSIYWPHFNAKLKRNLDPSIVYTEIMSVIKGGLAAGQATKGILSKDDYVALCNGKTSVLDEQKREIVYAIFLEYEKEKLENRNFDLADLVNDLHQRLKFEGYKGDSMDFVYIDEVQDLSMRQIELFKYVCTNVHEGFAFSGDTAQAIAKGIGFRFEDIRCLFFGKFLVGSQKGNMSEIFQLSENFRTHTGVLNLAQSVINLLYRFFPLFVDVLCPETSCVSGELPILLETGVNDNAIKTIFGRNGDGCQQITGFGADQVILVRDESFKKEIVDIIGKNALVLTIMESKGLEFQDVLLYNFFTTSSFANEWRIVYEYMKEKDQEKDQPRSPSTAPCSSFNMEKHIVLCSELKQLYVAITRTRQRLWISETKGFSQPIFEYWKALSIVQVKHLSDSFAEEMQIPSSREEWKSRGFKLFYENNLRMARMCFSKAGDKYSERLAEAYQLRATADCTVASQIERKTLLEDAAKLFISLSKNELAAECFYEIEDYKTAGDIYLSESMLEQAGNCYHLAKSYELAVEVYAKTGAFSKCLSACADGNLFETGFQLIGHLGGCDGAKQFLEKGALHYFGVKDMKNMMKFVHSFCSKDAMRSFLTGHRCYDELISLEKEWGNFEEAANVARMKPDPVLEADLLNVCGLRRESSLIILWHVFSKSPIFEGTDDPFTQKDELLMKAASIAKIESDDFFKFVCEEAKILSVGETREELLKKGLEFIYCYKRNVAAGSLERVKTTCEIEKIKKDVLHLILMSRDFYIVHAHEFSSEVLRYCRSELLSHAEDVLKNLQSRLDYSIKKNLSMHQQMKVLAGMFEVAKSLQKDKFPRFSRRASPILVQFFPPSVDKFLNNFFSINWKKTQLKEMISLRENVTFLNILKEVMNINSKSRKSQTCGQLWRMAMMLLGTKSNGFNDNAIRKVRYSSPNWRDFFDKLRSDGSCSKNVDLAVSLHNVLGGTFSAGWRSTDDCISPVCCLYLFERLLILASCCHGYILTTRSSCFEFLAYEEWGVHEGSNGACLTGLDTMKNIHCSLASMVRELLISEDDLKEWITRSREDLPYDILVLRLIVLLLLICANSGERYDLFYLLRRKHIVPSLPSGFYKALKKSRKLCSRCFIDAVAVACREIDNPLVTVSLTKDFSGYSCPDAIFLNMTKQDFIPEMLIEMLYPENSEDPATCSHDHEARES